MPDDLTSRIAQAWANTGLAIEDLWDVLETQIRVRIWDTAFGGSLTSDLTDSRTLADDCLRRRSRERPWRGSNR